MGLSWVSSSNVSCHWNVKNLMQKSRRCCRADHFNFKSESYMFPLKPSHISCSTSLLQRIPQAKPSVLHWGGFMAASKAAESRAAVCLSVLHTQTCCEWGSAALLLGPEREQENQFGLAKLPFPLPKPGRAAVPGSGAPACLWSCSGSCGQAGSCREQLRTGLMRGNQPP